MMSTKLKYVFVAALVGVAMALGTTGCKNEKSSIGETETAKALVISSNALGDIKLEMPVEEFLKLSKEFEVKKEVISLEGDDYDIYNAYKGAEKVFAVEPDGYNVWRIWIYGNGIKTEKGVQVGDTLKDIKANYKIKELAFAEGRIALMLENYNYSFLLGTNTIPEEWWQNQKLETLSEDLKIEMILL